ncbi:MAG: PaaI family thioesterase [Capsulimonadaceae bacterium]
MSNSLSLTDDGMCFGCGEHNPIGLRLTFGWDGDLYYTRYTPERLHQGWAGRTHGGILALVLDEVLSRAVLERYGLDWVTVELTTRLVRPAPVGRCLRIHGRVGSVRSRLITAEGEVLDEETGRIIASGTAKLMRAK